MNRTARAILCFALIGGTFPPQARAQVVLPQGAAAGAEAGVHPLIGASILVPAASLAPISLTASPVAATLSASLPALTAVSAVPAPALAAAAAASVPAAQASPAEPPAAQAPRFEASPGNQNSPQKRAQGAYEKTVAALFSNAGIRIDGDRPQDLTVSDPSFYRRFLSDPRLELGETYMDGHWNSAAVDRLAAGLMSAHRRDGLLVSAAPYWRAPIPAAVASIRHAARSLRDALINRQTRTLARTVAEKHYDAGNDLYLKMLDPTLTYTSGVWADGYTLEDAQNAKYDLLARKLGLRPGQHILDIGSGFGGFARFAAKNYGVRVTGITISVEQLKAARALSAGVEGVNFIYSDYRDLPHRFAEGAFDHAVSIEMIEAVGQKNLKTYFESVGSVLKDGGRFAIQAIASNRDVVNSNPWFSKYIFHNGVAPSTAQADRAARGTFGAPVDRQRITGDYDKTLLAWHANFTRAWPRLKDAYSERFKRMWDFYLLSVAGGFRARALQLDQTVYVKGGGRESLPPVRELPSRERLDALRATPDEEAAIAATIARLEDEKVAVAEASAPREKRAPIPLPKDARIAVIGAGPSGLSSALELRRLGYRNVVVFEKEAEAGGKSHTVEFAGRPHDMGATMGVSGPYAEIERLAAEQEQPTIPFPKQVQYDLLSGVPFPKASLGETLKLAGLCLRYMIFQARAAGQDDVGLEVPPSEFADSWGVLMKRLGLSRFGDKMLTYLTGYGYGGPDTPAVFGARMLSASAIWGAALGRTIMWENGTQPIWKGVASRLDVRTNAPIDRIQRGTDGVDLFLEGAATPERFDKIVLAVDPAAALGMLDATAEEKALFSRVRTMPYATFAVRVEGFAEGRAEVGYLKENMTLERMGRPMAWIKRYADDNVFVFHLFAPPEMSDEEITANIAADMGRLGATKATLVGSRRWPFFPHVDSETMREERFYERARNLQGRNRTVFVNEALGMSTMPNSAAQGRTAAQRLASGEY
jgi:cyclopropane-fatty-acyl-phospholipid synthase